MNRRLRFAATVWLLLCTFLLMNTASVSSAPVNFNLVNLEKAPGIAFDPALPTSLQFGPDGRLYVSARYGNIWALDVERTENGEGVAGSYTVTGEELITLVKTALPNHNDDTGAVSTEGFANGNRQVTGILVVGTADNPVIYVSSSDPREGGGNEGVDDANLDTNSGVISRLDWNGTAWKHTALVRGLPRSEENHSSNGMVLDEATNTLYLASGGFTNAGAPSANFAFITEYALSAAILAIDLDALAALEAANPVAEAVYDLPTLDDPTRPNNPDGSDVNDPFGGNDGLNQAVIDPTGPVQIASAGYRNAYDLGLYDGGMYVIDNGPNGGWGGHPIGEGTDECTNEWQVGEPGSNGPGTGGDPAVNNYDGLHWYALGSNYYGGHPAPTRGNFNAGLLTHEGNGDGTTATFRSQILPETQPASGPVYDEWQASGVANYADWWAANTLPVDWPPVPAGLIDARNCDYQQPGVDDSSIWTAKGESVNGLDVYTADNFEGELVDHVILASYANIRAMTVNDTKTTATAQVIAAPTGFPLDVIAQGQDELFGGTIWATIAFGSDSPTDIIVLEPSDYNGFDFVCTGADDDTIDEDGDGYTNADEIQNGTNPCANADRPADFDQAVEFNGFSRSDLLDQDDDNDGILDVNDPFTHDPLNGSDISVPVNYPMLNGDPGYGFFGLGFKGVMTNGVNTHTELMDTDDADFIPGGATGKFTVPTSGGTPYEDDNTQRNAFQLGVNVAPNEGVFSVKATLGTPLAEEIGQLNGMYIGNGDQDNYLLVGYTLRDNGGSPAPAIIVVDERGGVIQVDNGVQEFLPPNPSGLTIRLAIVVDPINQTAQPQYAYGSNPFINVGGPIDISGSVYMDLMNGSYQTNGVTTQLAAGILAHADGASEFQATVTSFDIEYGENTATGAWQLLNGSGGGASQRHENGYVQVGGKMYLMGGRGNKPLDIYDPQTDTWTQGSAPPIEMHHMQPVVLDGLIYVFGMQGKYNVTTGANAEVGLEHVYIYDPVSDTWVQGMEIPAARQRGSVGAVTYNNKIYIAGGLQGGHETGVSHAWFDEYDPYTNTWTPLTDAPRTRDHFNATVVGDKLVIAGGRSTGSGGSFENTIGEVDIYDFSSGTWTAYTDPSQLIPNQRGGSMNARLGNEVIVVGGEQGTNGANDATAFTEAFDINTLSWRSLAPLNQKRHASGLAVCDGVLYVAGGSGSKGGAGELNFTNNFQERYSLTGNYPTCDEPTPVPGAFSADTDPLNFGFVTSGTPSQRVQMTYSNTADQATIITGIALATGTNFSIDTPPALPLIVKPGASVPLDILFTSSVAGEQTDTLTLTSLADSIDVTLNGTASSGSLPVYRVNAGGGAVVDGGITWEAQTGFLTSTNGGNSPGGGIGINNTTAPDGVFDAEAYGNTMVWTFTGLDPNAPYSIRLHMLEGFNGANGAGLRVFDVYANGNTANPLLDDYDIWATANALNGGNGGMNYALTETIFTSADATGTITLEFDASQNNAAIRALEVIPEGAASTAPAELAVKDDSGNNTTLVTMPATIVGNTSTPVNVTLTNIGTEGTVSISNIAIVDVDQAYFTANPVGLQTINLNAGEEEPVTLTFSPEAANPNRQHNAVLRIAYNDGTGEQSREIALSGQGLDAPASGTVLYRVNGGGGEVASADSSTPNWAADTPGNPSIHRNGGGNKNYSVAVGNIDMSRLVATDPAPADLFASELYDDTGTPITYSFPVTAGTQVQVNLYMAELYFTATGSRLMDISLEGNIPTDLDNIDQFAEAGRFGAYKLTEIVTVGADNMLDIVYTASANNPAVKGIEIISLGAGTNTPPDITDPGDQVNNTGETVNLTLATTDPDATDTLTCSATGLPNGLSIDADCNITGTLSDTCTGTFNPGTGALIEADGYLVADMEFAPLQGDWSVQTVQAGSIGGSYYEWKTGDTFAGAVGPSAAQTLNYPIQINTPGIYEFAYRTNTPNSTEHNDMWIGFPDADAFFAIDSGNGFPTSSDPGQTGYMDITSLPTGQYNGSFLKAYTNAGNNEWSWQTRTVDGDAHTIYVEFATPGTYTMQAAGRSTLFKIDRMALYQNGQKATAQNINNPQSDTTTATSCVYNVTATVTDDGSPVFTDNATFQWTVSTPSSNVPPIFTNGLDDVTLETGTSATSNITATDANSDGLTLTATVTDDSDVAMAEGAGNFYTFTDNGDSTADITFNPIAGQSGVYDVTVNLSDGTNPNVVGTFTVTVTEPANNAPTFTDGIATVNVNVDTTGTHTVTATDIEADTLTLGASITDINGTAMTAGAGNFYTFTDNGDNTGSFSFTPVAGQEGTYTVSVTADDGNNPAVEETFSLIVNDSTGNLAPTFTAGISPVSTTIGTPASAEITATDANGDGLTFTATVTDDGGVEMAEGAGNFYTFIDNGDSTADITFNPTTGQEGTYTVSVSVTDGNSPAVVENFTLTVGPGAVPPEGTVLTRVNVGGPALASADGSTPNWTADTAVTPYINRTGGNNLFNGNNPSFAHTGPIIMTDPSLGAVPGAPAAVFNTERWDNTNGNSNPANNIAFAIPVTPGNTYQVNLLFAELFNGITAEGQRITNVEIEGSNPSALQGIDRIAIAGPKGAFVRSHTVTATDNTLNIVVRNSVENPTISGLEIVELNITSNLPPTLSAIGNQTVAESASLQVDFNAVDSNPDDTITFTTTVTNNGNGQVMNGDFYQLTDNGDRTGNLVFTPAIGEAGIYMVVVAASDGTNPPDEKTFTLTVTSLPDDSVVARVNVGGPALATADGSLPGWQADDDANPYPFRTGGNNIYSASAGNAHPGPIIMTDASLTASSTIVQAVFETERFDISSGNGNPGNEIAFNIPVTNGETYQVNLYFSELFSGNDAPGDRVLNASVEGTVPASFQSIDPVAVAGPKGAFLRTHSVTMTDDTLNISLTASSENPTLQGLEVIRTSDSDPLPTIAAIADQNLNEGATLDLVLNTTGIDPRTLSVNVTDGGNPIAAGDAFYTLTQATNTLSIAPQAGDAGTYTFEATVTDGNSATASESFTVTVYGAPSAVLEITPGGPLGINTFTGGSFVLTNTASNPNTALTGFSVDLTTAFLPTLVFDPAGTGGDASAKCLTPDTGTADTGFVAPADLCTDPFSGARSGGFDVMGMQFTDFAPAEVFTFSVDVDPNNIQGAATPGDAGLISGLEMVGATVTFTFSDGSTYTTQIASNGVAGGAITTGSETAPTGTLNLSVQGLTLNDNFAAYTDQTAQTININGPANAEVVLTHVDTRLHEDITPTCGYDAALYAANEILAFNEYTVTLDGSGQAQVPVTLVQTATGAGPAAGLNQFVATLTDTSQTPRLTGSVSAPIALDYPIANYAPQVTTTYTDASVTTGDTLNLTMAGCDIGSAENPALSVSITRDSDDTPATFFTQTDNGDGTGTFDIFPTATDAGAYTVTVMATDSATETGTATFALTVVGANSAPEITPPADQTVAEGDTLPINFTVTDADATDTVSVTAAAVDSTTTAATFPLNVTDNGGGSYTLSVSPGASTAETYTVTLTANDGVNPDVMATFTLTVTANTTPEITPPADQTVAEGDTLPINFTVTDADATDTVSVAAAAVDSTTTAATFPLNVTDNGGGSYTLSVSPGASTAETYTVTLTANDGVNPDVTATFTLTVTANNMPTFAAITDQMMNAGETLNYGVSASDNGTTLTLTAQTVPQGDTTPVDWAAFTDNADGTGDFIFTPPAGTSGVFEVTVTATDEDSNVTPVTFTVMVTDNSAPQITTISDQSMIEGGSLTIPVSITDTDTATLGATVTGNPAWASFTDNGDNTGELVLNPPAGTTGDFTVTITADDGVNAPTTLTFTLSVTADTAPEIVTVSNQTVTTGGTLDVPLTINEDSGSFTSAVTVTDSSSNPMDASFFTYDDATRIINFTTAGAPLGEYTVQVTADDGVNAPTTLTFTLSVVTDAAPIIAAIPTQSVVEENTLNVSLNITDNGTYTATVNVLDSTSTPMGAGFFSFDTAADTITFTPAAGQEGTYVVTVSADDGVNPATAASFTLTVTSGNTPSLNIAMAPNFTINESGNIGQFTVMLNTAPTADVIITVTSQDTSEVLTNVTSLTFTPDNWDITQTVNLFGVEDDEVDGNQTVIILLDPSGSVDPVYAALNSVSVAVVNEDNDTPTTTAENNETESGGGDNNNDNPVVTFTNGENNVSITITTTIGTSIQYNGDSGEIAVTVPSGETRTFNAPSRITNNGDGTVNVFDETGDAVIDREFIGNITTEATVVAEAIIDGTIDISSWYITTSSTLITGPGQPFTLTVTARPQMSVDNFVLLITLPAGVTLEGTNSNYGTLVSGAAASQTRGRAQAPSLQAGRAVRWTLGSVNAGENISATLNVRANDNAVGELNIRTDATVQMSGETFNDSQQLTVNVITALPQTGETPVWRVPLLILMGTLVLTGVLVTIKGVAHLSTRRERLTLG